MPADFEEQRRRRQAEGFIAIATGVQPEMECAKSIAKLLGNYWRPGMTIADIGCGVGHYQRTFRRVLAPDLSYVGVDKSPIHIAAARRTYPDAQFIQADINNLPFEDDAFPIVICTSVITALPPPPGSALSELIRIAGHVLVVRMLFGVINYVVRCYPERPPDNMDPTEMFAHKEIFTYRNIYTETYVRTLIEEAYPSASVEILPDIDYGSFNENNPNPLATRSINGVLISGNLVVDQRYLVVRKTNEFSP